MIRLDKGGSVLLLPIGSATDRELHRRRQTMRMRYSLTGTMALAAAGLLAASSVSADEVSGQLRRLSAEFQNNTSIGGSGEISTTAAAAANGGGGTVVYDKTLF